MLTLTVLVALTQILLVSAEGEIRKGAVSYKFHKESDTWGNAKRICEDEGGSLATPRDYNEYKAVIDKARKENTTEMWVGFHNIFNELEFLSIEDVGLHNYHEVWKQRPVIGYFNFCLMAAPEGLLQNQCYNKAPFMCEKDGTDIKKDIKSDKQCNKKVTGYKHEATLGRCYKYHKNPKTWAQAKRICEAEGSHLVIIRSKEEEDHVLNLVRGGRRSFNDSHVFVGMHNLFEKDKYVTVLNQPEEALPYLRFDFDQPTDDEEERCLAMRDSDLQRNGALQTVYCKNLLTYVCEG